MCRRFRSIEYGFFALASTGIFLSAQYWIISARPGNCARNEASRHGAMTSSSGASAAAVYERFVEGGNGGVDFSGIIRSLRGA